MYSKLSSQQELTSDMVRKIAPSVFATRPSTTRSDNYNFIPTNKIIANMYDSGYRVYGAIQSRTRVKENEGFQKHMIVMRHLDDVRSNASVCPEVLLINSHNGGGAFRLLSGEIRFACENGLIHMTDVQDDVRVSHRESDALAQVRLNMLELRDRAIKVQQETAKWREIRMLDLSLEKRETYLRDLFQLRWDREDMDFRGNILTMDRIRRQADGGDDLYTVMNRAQETLIRGGVPLTRWDDEARKFVSVQTPREVNSIDTRVAINRGVWNVTREFAKEFV